MASKENSIKELLERNVEQVIEGEHLEKQLRSGKKLRIKFGIDPTGDKIHIGRAVVFWKLREFQELGHEVVLVIGDFTAQIGDPSDKLEKRPFLTKAQIEKNLKNYLPQIGKMLDLKKVEVRYNSEWLKKLDFQEISQLAESFSVQQMTERRNFKERLMKHEEVSLREFLYPLMQGYDSVAIKANVELGGTDQLFNLMAGRKIQERYDQEPQDILVTKMLLGVDGRKMSTSWGNVINIADDPAEQYGKIMSVHDDQIPNYFELATNVDRSELANYENSLKKGENPKNVKEKLAFEVVKRYHGEKNAEEAADRFNKLFSKKETPEDLPELKLTSGSMTVLDLVLAADAVKSKSEGRRLIEQGGLEVDKMVIKDPQETLKLKGGEIIKIGKRRFFKAKISK